jgi:hypothetical protein
MKIRIEIEIGDKIIADEMEVPDHTFKFAVRPDGMMANIRTELWNRMAEARQNALTEFMTKHKPPLPAKMRSEWA